MKIAKILTAVSLFCSFQAHGRGYVIGNGGDGYSVNGSIFVADLLEIGLEKISLAEDGAISPRIARNLDQIGLPFAYPRDALARKLTELNARVPGLADCLIVAMGLYRWRMVAVPIGLVNDLEGRTIGIPESLRVQLAVRLSDVIRIQQSVWDQLNETNKVALLLHEAFYSLVAPTIYQINRSPDGSVVALIETQSPRKTRELVGLAFDNDTSNRLLKLAIDYLGLEILGGSGPLDLIPKWNVKLVKAGNVAVQEFTFAFPQVMPIRAVKTFIAETCRSAIKTQTALRFSRATLVGALDQPSFKPTSVSYRSPFGDQTAISIELVSESSLNFQQPMSEQAACENALGAYVEAFRALGLI